MAQSSNARHRRPRSVLAAMVAVLAATLFTVAPAGATGPTSSGSGTGSAAVPQLDWRSCAAEGPELGDFECATAVVPLDPFLFSDEVRAGFDLVGFDPRGVIRSTRCAATTFDEAIADQPPFPIPVTREEERIKIESDRALAGACAERAARS